MDLLGGLFGGAGSLRRRLGASLRDPVEATYQGVRNFGQDWDKTLDTQAQAYPFTATPEQAARTAKLLRTPDQARAELAVTGADMGMGAATVWHGSPHTFSKFDSGKIGTGEGAQAYGSGMYFAEAPEVAEGYKKALSSKYPVSHSGVLAENGKYSAWAKRKDSENVEIVHTDPSQRVAKKALKDYLADKRGALYKVDLPDEHIEKMINLDLPIEQAPKAVRDYYTRVGAYRPGRPMTEHMAIDRNMAKEFSAAGIPGARYLDSNSRGAGQGTSNYVVFPGEEGILKILARNGAPLK